MKKNPFTLIRLNKNYFDSLSVLPNKFKYRILSVLIISLIAGVLEGLSLFLIGPFISSLTNEQQAIPKLFNFLGLDNQNSLQVLALSLILVAIMSSIFRAARLNSILSLSKDIGHYISNKLFHGLVGSKEIQLKMSGADGVNLIVRSLRSYILGIRCFLDRYSAVLITFLIFSASVLSTGKIILYLILTTTLIYIFLSAKINQRLLINSKIVLEDNMSISKTITNAINSFKEIVVYKLYAKINKEYNYFDNRIRKANIDSEFWVNIPKIFLDTVFISFIAISGLILFRNEDIYAISILGTITFASLRIIPMANTIFASWSKVVNFAEDLISITKYYNLSTKDSYLSGYFNYLKEKKSSNKFQNRFKRLELRNLEISILNISSKGKKYAKILQG